MAKMEFDKAKYAQKFVKFPDDMGSQTIFMNIKKKVQDITLHPSEKSFKE